VTTEHCSACANGVTAAGNFEHGNSVLQLALSVEEVAKTSGIDVATVRQRLELSRQKLFAAREKRVKTGAG